MTSDIHLLGRPFVEVDGDEIRGPRGNKAWAILCYLVCSQVPISRSRLSGLLFAEADDPQRALRWNLNQLRPILGNDALRGDPLMFERAPDTRIDVLTLMRGASTEAARVALHGGELLEGSNFDAVPAFETWLHSERSHLRQTSIAVLREEVLARFATAESKEAIDAATALVELDPLVEAHHALLIRAYIAAGDRASATRHATHAVSHFQKELGIDPGPVVLDALREDKFATTMTSPNGAAAVRAHLEAGRAATNAGILDVGLDCFARAVTEAQACGEFSLKAEAMLEMGSALAHAGRDRDEEAAAALHAALTLGEQYANRRVAAIAASELAWLEFLAARYDRAETWLARARAGGPDDDQLMARVLWITGKLHMERGRFRLSIEVLRSAIQRAEQADDGPRLAFCHVSLGRTYLVMRALDDAKGELDTGLSVIARSGASWLTPLVRAFLSEVTLLGGDVDTATRLATEALTMAEHVSDSSMEALAERALALCLWEQGDADAALARAIGARARLIERPDHMWSFAYVLDALCGIAIAHGTDDAADWVDELEALASGAGMTDVLARAHLHRVALGRSSALEAASVTALASDNPALAELLTRARAESHSSFGSTSFA